MKFSYKKTDSPFIGVQYKCTRIYQKQDAEIFKFTIDKKVIKYLLILFIGIAGLMENKVWAQTTLWGLTNEGGANNKGVIFQYNPSTSMYTTKHDFAGVADGSNPQGSLMLASDGKLYGMTHDGGTNNFGVLFQYDTNTNIFTKKIDFNGSGNGKRPNGSLIQAADGKLYGLTEEGGSYNYGVLFQYDPITNILTKKIDFNGTAYGNNPFGSLIQATDGNLYGITSGGGTLLYGVLFKYNPASGILTKILDFDGANLGGYAQGSLMQAADGNIYGMTAGGGVNFSGVLFQYNINTNTYIKKIDFNHTPNGDYPHGTLVQASDGNLYGMTLHGGSYYWGNIIQYNPSTNTFINKFNFAGTSNGYYPYGSLMHASDNNLYGMTMHGGANNFGVVFQFDYTTDVFNKIFDFNSVSGQRPIFGNLIELGAPVCTPPTISCPSNQFAYFLSNSCETLVTYSSTPVVTGTSPVLITHVFTGATIGSDTGSGSGSIFNAGTTQVKLIASNSCGRDSCTFNVIVTDSAAPSITNPGNQILSVIPNSCIANFTIADPISDNCTGSSWGYSTTGATTLNSGGNTITDGSGSGILSFNKGITTITLSGTDGTNAATMVEFMVTVNDVEAPNAGTDGSLIICEGSQISEPQLNSALSGEDAGGTWSPAPAGAGIYTYIVSNSPCNSNDTSMVTVTSTICGMGNPNSIVSSSNPVCLGTGTTLTCLGAAGTVYWYTSACGGTEIGTGNAINVSPGETTTYYARNFIEGIFSGKCASITITPCECGGR